MLLDVHSLLDAQTNNLCKSLVMSWKLY